MNDHCRRCYFTYDTNHRKVKKQNICIQCYIEKEKPYNLQAYDSFDHPCGGTTIFKVVPKIKIKIKNLKLRNIVHFQYHLENGERQFTPTKSWNEIWERVEFYVQPQLLKRFKGNMSCLWNFDGNRVSAFVKFQTEIFYIISVWGVKSNKSNWLQTDFSMEQIVSGALNAVAKKQAEEEHVHSDEFASKMKTFATGDQTFPEFQFDEKSREKLSNILNSMKEKAEQRFNVKRALQVIAADSNVRNFVACMLKHANFSFDTEKLAEFCIKMDEDQPKRVHSFSFLCVLIFIRIHFGFRSCAFQIIVFQRGRRFQIGGFRRHRRAKNKNMLALCCVDIFVFGLFAGNHRWRNRRIFSKQNFPKRKTSKHDD